VLPKLISALSMQI